MNSDFQFHLAGRSERDDLEKPEGQQDTHKNKASQKHQNSHLASLLQVDCNLHRM